MYSAIRMSSSSAVRLSSPVKTSTVSTPGLGVVTAPKLFCALWSSAESPTAAKAVSPKQRFVDVPAPREGTGENGNRNWTGVRRASQRRSGSSEGWSET